jgi:hypothetical protein
VKKYRSPRELLVAIDQTLAAPTARNSAPLDEVVRLIFEGRNYAWTAIYLAETEPAKAQEFRRARGGGGRVRVPIKVGQRVLGVLEIEPGGRTLASADTILLRDVGTRLARFLSGRGKYLMRKVRALGKAQAAEASSPKLQPASETAGGLQKRAAAGESRH